MKQTKFSLENRIFLTDGAMGTMLERAGFSLRDNTALLSVTSPFSVEKIHAAYFEAGSDIVFSNTFSASPLKLEGSGHTPEEVIAAAVGCAKRAVPSTGGLVGLDIGPLGKMISPLGPLSFDEAVALFARQISAGAKAGADLIAIETMMDLQEAKAALLAAKTTCSLPVMVTMTFEASGRTFTGCDAVNMALTLESAGADVIGINCSVGPAQMRKVVETLAKWTTLPIAVKPNAGLPDENGNYTLDADSFAEGVCGLIAAGASVVGGCCGTEPGFIASLKKIAKHHFVEREKFEPPAALCSGTRCVVFDKPVLAGNRLLYPNDEIRNAWQQRDFDTLADEAAEQSEEGAALIAVTIPKELSKNEAQEAVEAIQAICPLPLIIKADDPDTADAALRATRGRPALLIKNNAAKEALFDVAAKNGAMVIAPLSLCEKVPAQQPGCLCLFSLYAPAGSQRPIAVHVAANENPKVFLADALAAKIPLILADPADPVIIEAVDKGVFE